jgi:TorA maturation chaperone TorD
MLETGVQQADLIRALGSLVEEPTPAHAPVAEALGLPSDPEPGAYTHLFVMNLYPYASVYCGAEGMLGGEARDRVAGFWRAVGASPPPEPDHLGALLGLWAELEERSAEGSDADSGAEQELGRRAVDALLWEHLLPWAPVWLGRAVELGDPYYGRWAEILLDLLRERTPGVIARVVGQGEIVLPLHLRSAPGLPDPRTTIDGAGERFMDALLAPVRSGTLLTRVDLLRAGREMGLGVRIGERKYTLRALFGQDPWATLRWVGGEMEGWGERHRRQDPAFAPLTRFWRDRARQGAALLNELASSEAASDWAGTHAVPAGNGERQDA